MALVIATNSQGKQVIAEKSEAEAFGWKVSTPSNSGANAGASTAPAPQEKGTITHPIGGTIEEKAGKSGGIMQEVGGKTTYYHVPATDVITTVHLEAGPPYTVPVAATATQLGQVYLQTGYQQNPFTGQFFKISNAPPAAFGTKEYYDTYFTNYWRNYGVNMANQLGGYAEYVATGTIMNVALMPLTQLGWAGRIAIGTAGVGFSTYGLSKDYMQGTLTAPKTILYAVGIGLGAASIYSGFSGMNAYIQQKKLIDPIISKIDVKGYYESAAEIESQKTLYVPKYGTEYGLGESAGNLKTVLLGQPKNIYGEPQTIPESIKPYDFAYEIKYAVNQKGIEILKTSSFKITAKGFEPMGMIDLNRYYPTEPRGLTNILDYFAPDKLERWQLNLGYTKSLIIKGGQPSIDIGEIDFSDSINRFVSIKQIAIEKPAEFIPTMFKGSPKVWITTGDYTPTFDFISVTNINKIFDDIAGKVYVNAPGKSFGAAQIAISKPAEIIVNEIPTPIGYNEVGGLRFNVPHIDYSYAPAQSSFNINVPVLNVGKLQAISNNQMGGNKSIIINENKLTEITAPMNFNIFKSTSMSRLDTSQRQFNVEMTTPINITRLGQPQLTQQITEQETITGYQQVFTNKPYNPQTYKIEPDFYFPLDSRIRGGQQFKIIVKPEFGEPKIFKVSSHILPTASMYSLERSFAKYGSGSLARGANIEKIFRNLARSSGLAAEFPAAEFIKRGGRRR